MRHRSSKALRDAQSYYQYLLYSASGGTLGEAPIGEVKNESMTFGEKRGLLDSIIKIAEMERKNIEDNPQESAFERIQRGINGSRKNRDRGSRGEPAEGASYDERASAFAASNDADASESTEVSGTAGV